MPSDNLPQTTRPFHSGYVAIVGWPNVGKSTLSNALLGMKLSIVTPKPQTTREAVLGILNSETYQMIFLDTPGWLTPKDAFQGQMKRAIVRSMHDDADVLVWVIDPQGLSQDQKEFGANLARTGKPAVVVVNKIDVPGANEKLKSIRAEIEAVLPQTKVIPISAKNRTGVNQLTAELAALLPIAPPYFPVDQVTNRWERFYVGELIREQLFTRFQEEVPHAAAVLIEDFIEKEGRKDLIHADIIVETEGQKKIVIGQKGMRIKELGQASRNEIERLLARPVFLELRVKVKKNWRKDPAFLKMLEERDQNHS